MQVLFSHGYYYPLDAKQWKQSTPFAPLGTMIAAAYARENGYEVSLYDVALKSSSAGITSLLTPEIGALVIYDDGFNYLTKMCLTTMREESFEMIKRAKKQNLPVVVCSSDSTDHYRMYLAQGADVVILGEGEQGLLEVLNALKNKQSFSEITGIAFSDHNEVQVTPPRPVMRTLDDLPLPAWDLVDVDAYKKVWQRSGLPFQLNVATTRGCPYKCNWCAKPIYGQRYNVRSPQKVVQELQYLKAHYGVTNLWMCDDIFGLKPGWVQSFNEGLKEAGLTVTYKIQSRADLLLKENNLEALVQSGLIEAWIGAESGSQKILDAMDKGTTVDQIYTATELLQKNGVKVGHFLQFGYLGETEKDIQATFSMLQKAKPDLIGVSVSYPLPGTPFYEKVKDQLGQKANWTDSDDLALMFKNTYNQRYYKILHSLVHKSFTFQKVLNQFKQSYFKGATIKQTLQLLFFPPLIWGYKLLLSTQNNTH